MTTVDPRRAGRESAVSALSLTMVGMTAIAIVLLARAPELAHTVTFHAARGAPANVFAAQGGSSGGDPHLAEITRRFQQAVMMLHAQRYEYAVTALHQVIEMAPRMPEAYVNMGFALLGLKRYTAARDFFNTATDLRPYQGNAYWGLAESLEQLGDLEGALGAMRTYIHLAPPGDPYVRRARSALWEWESTLKRGPLPPAEAEWLTRKGREWEDRNSPERDGARSSGRQLIVKELE